MPIKTGVFSLDRSSLPSHAAELPARFSEVVVNDKAKVILIGPGSDPDYEPRFARFLCGIILRLSDGTVAQNQGQLVISGRRILGMVTDGSVGGRVLNSQVGSVYAFSIDRDEIKPPVAKKNWRGKSIEVGMGSSDASETQFVLQVFSVVASVTDRGEYTYSSLDRFLERFTPSGLEKLLER